MTSKELATYIQKDTRVILPNFGAFLQKSTDDGVFNANNITFSPFLRFNDGVLESQIAKDKGITIEAATKEVLDLIDEIARSIAATQSYKIEGIGFLVLDKNHNISFKVSINPANAEPAVNSSNNSPIEPIPVEPKTETSQTQPAKSQTDSINSITKDKRDQSDSTETSNNQINNKQTNNASTKKTPIINSTANQPLKEMPEMVTPKRVQKKSDDTSSSNIISISIGRKIAIIALFVIISLSIIIGIAFIIRNTVFLSDIEISKPEPIVNVKENAPETINDDSKTDTTKNNINEGIETTPEPIETSETEEVSNIQDVENKIEKNLIQNSSKSTNSTKFYLVVGSFKENANAKKLCEDLVKKNFKAIVVLRPNNTYIVSIDSYSTKNEANAAKEKYSQLFPAAWVMSQPQ